MKRRAKTRKRNPAASAAQYRLAQAVLSGVARSKGMTATVAREIVDRTPERLRKKWARPNPAGLKKWTARKIAESIVSRVKHLKAGRKKHGSRNPFDADTEEAAREVFGMFHGAKATKVEEIVEEDRYRENLAQLGKLLRLDVLLADGRTVVELDLSRSGVKAATAPTAEEDAGKETGRVVGGQIYFVKGDQRLDLDRLQVEDQLNKDYIKLGEAIRIDYFSSKHFHDFAPTHYYHELGEKGGFPPELHYDAINEKFFLTGGSYMVYPAGILH